MGKVYLDFLIMHSTSSKLNKKTFWKGRFIYCHAYKATCTAICLRYDNLHHPGHAYDRDNCIRQTPQIKFDFIGFKVWFLQKNRIKVMKWALRTG